LNASALSLPSLDLIRAERARRAAQAERDRLSRDAEKIRERCRSLTGFVREAWHVLEPNQPYVHGWHIDAIAEHLSAITDGEITRLLINIPPGTMKSLLSGVFWPAWEWGPVGMSAMRYLGSSYSEDYAKRDNRRMRDLVSSEWYRRLWPEIELVRAGETEFANTATGFRKGVPFARLTGGRGDRVIIDDPHSTETAESEAERRNTTRVFTESVPTRLNNPERSAIIIIMQRLHEGDVSGVILARDLGYEHLMLPMEFEPERRCATSIGFRDPRQYDGDLLFPERFPREVVERDKKVLGAYATAGQFQQRPAPREGGLFKHAWFQPIGAMPAKLVRTVRAWDLAATAKTTSNNPDWTAGVIMSKTADGLLVIHGCRRFQGSPMEVEGSLLAQAPLDGQRVVIRLAQDPGQAGKAQAEQLVRKLSGYIVRVARMTGDKATRAAPLASQAEAGNVRILLTGDPIADAWVQPFIDELCMFPAGHNDDQVDAAADAFNELALGGSRYDIAALTA
jgi:predicted phage terminase large subunit-like protein